MGPPCGGGEGVRVVGREEELAAVRRLLETPAEPTARALLIEGEPGIGKTTLWHAGVAAAEELGYVVLRCRPAESEFQLAYAGLGDLLGPILTESLPALPPPQRRALKVALLLDDARDRPPDPRAVGLAVATAVRAIAGARPTLIALDDAQWLDKPSTALLEFALRRL
jgi:predicted ATPase